MVHTPEDQVAALGDERLASEHFSQESDLNELIELVSILRERLGGADKLKVLGERDELLRHGDKLAAVPANGGSPLLVQARAEIAREWQEVRKQLERLSGVKGA